MFECQVCVCKLLVLLGICDEGVKYGLVLIEELDGIGIIMLNRSI